MFAPRGIAFVNVDCGYDTALLQLVESVSSGHRVSFGTVDSVEAQSRQGQTNIQPCSSTDGAA